MLKSCLIILILGMTVCAIGGRTAPSCSATEIANRQTQTDFLDHVKGKWMFENSVFGDGFISSTFPSSTTPPREILRTGQKISFTVDLQTAQGPYGQAIKEPFTFTLEESGGDYSVSVDSKSWLKLSEQKLVAEGSGLKGDTTAQISGKEWRLSITIKLTPPAGHEWDFTASSAAGKDRRWFKLTFKPPRHD